MFFVNISITSYRISMRSTSLCMFLHLFVYNFGIVANKFMFYLPTGLRFTDSLVNSVDSACLSRTFLNVHERQAQ